MERPWGDPCSRQHTCHWLGGGMPWGECLAVSGAIRRHKADSGVKERGGRSAIAERPEHPQGSGKGETNPQLHREGSRGQ